MSYATPRRQISIWEVHVHNYMATLPLFLLMLIVVINWPVVVDAAQGRWSGQFEFRRLRAPHGSDGYLPAYLALMTVLCVLPYVEENVRCLRRRLRAAA